MRNMRFYIRADASDALGIGHVMRCLTLADKLSQSKCDIVFLYNEMPNFLIDLIKQKGHSSIELHSQVSIGSYEDAVYVSKAIELMDNDSKGNAIIIDHYSIDSTWESVMKRNFLKVIIIDDLANRPHECDLLIDVNAVTDMKIKRYRSLVPKGTKLLVGPQYALLRDEFSEARKRLSLKQENETTNIFVCFGGTDPTNETFKVLKAIAPIIENNSKYSVNAIVGRSNPNNISIVNYCNKFNNIKAIVQPQSIAENMLKADFAICSGGGITWERYSLGLPALTIAIAENQIDIARQGEKLGIDKYLGTSFFVNQEIIKFQIVKYLEEDKMYLNRARHLALKIVDGLGADKISKNILSIMEGN